MKAKKNNFPHGYRQSFKGQPGFPHGQGQYFKLYQQ